MTRKIQTPTTRLKRITANNTFLSFGFGVVARSAWDLEASSIASMLLYAGITFVSGILLLAVCVMTLMAAYNLRASDSMGLKMLVFVLGGGMTGLFLSILPSFAWILGTYIFLFLLWVTVLSEGLGIVSKQYPPAQG